MIEVTWIGGPNDGESFTVHPNQRYIIVAIYTGEPPFANPKNINPEDTPITKNIKVDIVLTRNGYRAYWPY